MSDLSDFAKSWQEAIDELEDFQPTDTELVEFALMQGATWEYVADADTDHLLADYGEAWKDSVSERHDDLVEDCAKYADLASDLGLIDATPDDLRDAGELILASEFEDYARELAADIGAIPDDARWPCTCIDWARAARDLSQDYTSVTFDGDDYYYREG